MLRDLKRGALSAMKIAGLFALSGAGGWRRSRLLILAWHGIAQDDEARWDPSLFVEAALLEQRLEYLAAGGFAVLPLQDALDRLYAGTLPPRSVALTFDDGYVDFYRLAFPLLQRLRLPATVYLTTYYAEKGLPPPSLAAGYMLWKRRGAAGRLTALPGIDRFDLGTGESRQAVAAAAQRLFTDRTKSGDEKQALLERLAAEIGFDYAAFRARRLMHLMTAEETREVAAAGVDVQLHTHRHTIPRVEDRLRREIEDNRRRIEALTSRPADHFCYPSGVHHPFHPPWLKALGIRSGATCDVGYASAADDPLLLPRFLDHSRVSQIEFEAWATGVLPRAWPRARRIRQKTIRP